ncbi:MAG: HPr kinase/phosphatase C-terminal domain-containing protein [Pseudomonadota bacterium]
MTLTIHASTVALGEHGVLVRGVAGAGKSALCLSLVEQWQRHGAFAALVADDRTALTRHGHRLIARPAATLAGFVEVRGAGIVPIKFIEAVRLTAVVDLAPAPERMPEAGEQTTDLSGIFLPRIMLHELAGPQGAVDLWHVLGPNGLTFNDRATQRDLSEDRA